MSRNPEAISEVLEEVLEEESAVEIENLCAEIVNRLLTKHMYAKNAEVRMETDFIIMKESPVTRHNTQETTKVMADASGVRNGDDDYKKDDRSRGNRNDSLPMHRKQHAESTKQELLEFLDEETTQKVLDKVPFASHNQRGKGMIMIEVPEQNVIRGEDLISIIEDSMSSPVCELLKRVDENAVVVKAHQNPKFVEDCVRTMIHKIVNKYSYLPDDTMVTVRQINEESIHRHNAFAEKVATLADLKKR